MTTKTDPTLTENTDYLTSSSSSTTTPVALTAPVLTLDQADTDYAPGETVGITASNVAVGGSVQFSVAHVTGGVDGIVGTADDVLTHDLSGTVAPWTVTDGGAGDLDGAANGAIQTSWYVNQDAAYQAFVLSATDEATGATAQTAFTDAPGSTSKVYQHWADAGGPEWNNNILNDNKSNYFEGEVVPHVYVYKASNQAPLTNGQSYSINITYNFYEQGPNAGGFDYITTYNVSRAPGQFDATNPHIEPSLDGTFTNGGGIQGTFYTVDANITNVSAVTYTGSGNKDGHVTVTFTYTGATTTNGIAEIFYGLHIARPGDVPNQGAGPTNGASAWTGGSLQTTVDIGGSGATSI